ncbi:DUF928 domain-containing protein [Pantanalinema rosaneae CENA516]|uniref:DUF928 domain-containing protein n=1 Tax=Pantanalinema rosaneae TaxID=1620701 RepID=UPI003D6E84E9
MLHFKSFYTQLIAWISIFLYSITFFLSSFVTWVPPAEASCYFIFFCSNSKSSFRSKGGVRRGPCATEEFTSIVALAPEKKLKSALGSRKKVASTVQDYPTFWFYLPPYQNSIQSVEFVLLDEGRHLFQEPIYAQLPQNSSGMIAGLTLLNRGKALEVGKQYSWYFSILCDPYKPSRNPELTGQIQRVLPSTLIVSNKPDYLVYDNTYTGQEGIESVVFYDTVTQLIEKRSSYLSDWSTLLSNAEIPDSAKPVKLDILDSSPEHCSFPS